MEVVVTMSISPISARRVVAACLSAGLFLAASFSSYAATYYVRTDGGDANQCTGKADAAYPGSGTGQACAWKHPFFALPPGGSPRIAGGDTLIIGTGSYQMGLGAPGANSCNQSWSWDCYMSAVPSGPSATTPTRILGKGHDTGCTTKPELWGTERASMVLNLQGSSNVELACLEVTDHSSCIESHCHAGGCSGEVNACNRSSAPYGPWAATGLKAVDSRNVKLRDINIHGMANRGVLAGRIADWDTTRLTIRASGWAGWDGDLGTNSSNSGQLVFRQAEIAWNGCGEKYPSKEIFGCWAQQSGGYGDGLGTGATGGHWVFEDSLVHHNTSDGIDLLYMTDGGSVTVRRTWVEGNASNQVKTKGNSRVENSVIVGNCAYFVGHGNMKDGDHCRASGVTVSLGLFGSSQVNLVNNTITGQGDCLVVSGGGSSTAKLNLANNVMVGQTDWRQNYEKTCAHYGTGGEQVTWTKNNVTNVKNGTCPSGSQCTDPKLTSTSLSSFKPTPASGSPLVDVASTTFAPGNDYYGRARPAGAGPDIGAVEMGASGGGTAPTPPPPSSGSVFRSGFE